MNKQHEELEKKGVKSLINQTFYGKKKPKGKKLLKKWQKEENDEQEELDKDEEEED